MLALSKHLKHVYEVPAHPRNLETSTMANFITPTKARSASCTKYDTPNQIATVSEDHSHQNTEDPCL